MFPRYQATTVAIAARAPVSVVWSIPVATRTTAVSHASIRVPLASMTMTSHPFQTMTSIRRARNAFPVTSQTDSVTRPTTKNNAVCDTVVSSRKLNLVLRVVLFTDRRSISPERLRRGVRYLYISILQQQHYVHPCKLCALFC